MNENSARRLHWSFWLIGSVALLWNAMGLVNFFVQMNPDVLARYSAAERLLVETRPVWATVAFGVGVFAGTLGSILLLLRKSAAYYVFVVSLLGIVVTHIHTLNLAWSLVDFGPVQGTAILMTLVVAAFLVWYSKRPPDQV